MLTWLGRRSDDIREAKEAPHTVTSFFDTQLTLADLPLVVELCQIPVTLNSVSVGSACTHVTWILAQAGDAPLLLEPHHLVYSPSVICLICNDHEPVSTSYDLPCLTMQTLRIDLFALHIARGDLQLAKLVIQRLLRHAERLARFRHVAVVTPQHVFDQPALEVRKLVGERTALDSRAAALGQQTVARETE